MFLTFRPRLVTTKFQIVGYIKTHFFWDWSRVEQANEIKNTTLQNDLKQRIYSVNDKIVITDNGRSSGRWRQLIVITQTRLTLCNKRHAPSSHLKTLSRMAVYARNILMTSRACKQPMFVTSHPQLRISGYQLPSEIFCNWNVRIGEFWRIQQEKAILCFELELQGVGVI